MSQEALAPGRKLDMLVAEKVMGLKMTHFEDVWNLAPYETLGRYHYSTDISAAWEVWEWLNKNHPWKYRGGEDSADILMLYNDGKPTIGVMNTYWDGGLWSLDDKEWVKDSLELDTNPALRGETFPHVICKLALKAVGAL